MPTDYLALLRQGDAPAPETGAQKTDYLALLRQPPSPPTATPDTQPGGIEQAAREVTREMGAIERATVGLGRGLTLAGRGAKLAALAASVEF